MANTKIKSLSTLYLIYFAVFAFGLQFANSLQLANMASLYRFFGVPGSYLPYVSLAAPLSGLLVQPLIGQLSDDTFSRYGKRRPYIFVWGMLTFIACCAIPFANSLWLMMILLWTIGCSINGCVEALRALTGDVVANHQKAKAFSMQTIFSGVGAGCAAMLPYFLERFSFIMKHDWLAQNRIPLSIKIDFIVGGIVLFLVMIFMLKKVKERIPTRAELLLNIKKKKRKNAIQRVTDFFVALVKNIRKMPQVIRQLAVIQIFTWIGLFALWVYFSIAIAQHIYGLPRGADVVSNAYYANLLEKGTVQAGIFFGIYQFVSVAYAFVLPIIVEKYSEKFIHGISLIIGAIGLLAMGITHSLVFIGICMVAVGIMWGSIMTLPYSIVSASLPHGKMGVYLGLFNISITLPQIIAGFILQPLYTYLFQGRAIFILSFSGMMILIGGIITLYQLLPTRSIKPWFSIKVIRKNA